MKSPKIVYYRMIAFMKRSFSATLTTVVWKSFTSKTLNHAINSRGYFLLSFLKQTLQNLLNNSFYKLSNFTRINNENSCILLYGFHVVPFSGTENQP